MLSDQQEPDMFVSFMKMLNSCVENGNVIPGNYGKWISQPQHDSISTTIEKDPAEYSDGNDEPVEYATGADITDLDSDNDDDDQPSSGFPSSPTINAPSPLPNSPLPEANDPPVEPSRPKRQRRIPSHLQDYQL